MNKRTADPAEAAAVAADESVHTYAQTAATRPTKPAHHLPTLRRPRDEFAGIGGTYLRDPETGKRTLAPPVAMPAAEPVA
ncbi:hypothetical protein [Acidovorax sp. NCPPB 4044]|uniref:hypothetical protein n=1 Tax=Acidovorax sp. NCPPB 4044 TaxID=2940490 RepID=UPI002303D0B5|nr:hypothetical protein [Acidovorax sp. NCPPB 4044]MDA8522310.1 hypothetical protein [Acidovorax sp. NCPPB 4044]